MKNQKKRKHSMKCPFCERSAIRVIYESDGRIVYVHSEVFVTYKSIEDYCAKEDYGFYDGLPIYIATYPQWLEPLEEAQQ